MRPAEPGDQVELTAGAVRAVLERGALRWIRVGGIEILRGIYMAVRDEIWGTAEPDFERYVIDRGTDRFRVEMRARNQAPSIDFEWEGVIEGDASGIRFSFEGAPRTRFRTSRIGLCVLHPAESAGQRVVVETPWGNLDGSFPDQIAPLSFFGPFVRLHQQFGRGFAQISFEGDLFEMEDQRNWTDASFKTYSTPLQLPSPRWVEPGQRITQSVAVEVSGIRPSSSSASLNRITVSGGASGVLPEIGLLAPASPPTDAALDRLRDLRPGHVRVSLDSDRASWRESLATAANTASALGARLEVELLLGPSLDRLPAMVDAIGTCGVAIARVIVFDRELHVTTGSAVDSVRRLASSRAMAWPIGGGSRADFAELNALRLQHVAPLPLDALDCVGYRVVPQIHAIDDATIIENLEGFRATIRSAQKLAPGKPIAVGPVTLRQQFNPYASDGQRGAAMDPRQAEPFNAAWTLALIQIAAAEGAAFLTCHQLIGPAGVLGEGSDPAPYPVFDLLAAVQRGDRQVVLVKAPRSIAAIGMAEGTDFRLLAANLTRQARTVTVEGAAGSLCEIAGHASGCRSDLGFDVTFEPYAVIECRVAGTPAIHS